MPRNAHSVSEMFRSHALRQRQPLRFQAASNVLELNQNQPMIESRPTGMMTPHTVIDPIRSVMRGLPKLAAVVSHRRAISATQVMTGVEVNTGKKPARYPTADADRDVTDRQ